MFIFFVGALDLLSFIQIILRIVLGIIYPNLQYYCST